MFFLLLFLITFAIPYVGRAIWWGAVTRVEPVVLRAAETESADLRERLAKANAEVTKLKHTRETLAAQRQKLEAAAVVVPWLGNVVDGVRAAELQLDVSYQSVQLIIDLMEKRLDHLDDSIKNRLEPRSVLSVILHWDRGWSPTFLAFLLVLYNLGVYRLITNVGALRDEEERSGYSPAWDDYRPLIRIHRVVTGLFYVSLASFAWNIVDLLGSTVYLPKPAFN